MKAKLNTTVKAKVSFVRGRDFPTFQQNIGSFGSAGPALAKFRTATRVLDGCTDVSYEADGHRVSGSIGRLSFPKLGKRSAAWRISLSAEGTRLEVDVVLVHKGAELEELVYLDVGSVDLDAFTPLARKAVSKMPAS